MASLVRQMSADAATLASHKARKLGRDRSYQRFSSKKKSPSMNMEKDVDSLVVERKPRSTTHNSDSDLSVAEAESNSVSAETDNETTKSPVKTRVSKHPRRNSEWEILEGLKDGQRHEKVPVKCEGYLMKKRKWPLKGWHKRYFVLDKGFMVYAKNPADVARGKLHGTVDVGLSVISAKPKRGRMDIDAEELIFHLKIKSPDTFDHWVKELKDHRLYRQHVLSYGTGDSKGITSPGSPMEENIPIVPLALSAANPPLSSEKTFMAASRDGSLTRGLKPPQSPTMHTPISSRVGAWIMDSFSLDQTSKEISLAQQNLSQLEKMFEQMESMHTSEQETSITEASSPNVKKDRKKFGLRKKKGSKGSSVDLSNSSPNKTTQEDSLRGNHMGGMSSTNLTQMTSMSTSNSSLLTVSPTLSRPHSFSDTYHFSAIELKVPQVPDNRIREDFLILSKDVLRNEQMILQTLLTERERLKQAIETDSSIGSAGATGGGGGGAGGGLNASALVTSLRNSLNQVLQQNAELRARLSGIQKLCDTNDLGALPCAPDAAQKSLHQSLSYSSSCLSNSEYYDAKDTDDPLQGTSSEESFSSDDEGSVTSENSDVGTDYTPAQSAAEQELPDICTTGRRTKLPVPMPDTSGISLWNLLCRNIGKDLSKVAMPVTINEPLNMLQRMCEELEYSELLDKASEMEDPYDRMVQVAAFAVSAYGSSSFREGHKPFNPLLGETYECIREDKGFRFISEQVSHHPPICVCYAESRNFIFWQEMRIKTKFWGKSMEFQPLGSINVKLPRYGDHYRWNKITTCVHNLFGGQRWVDQYGELNITNGNILCKLSFVKASYWSAKRHEVYGTVTDEDGHVVRNLFGKWSEALYCGVAPSAKLVWRLGTMPEEHELYYGFTRFAIELNELDPEMAKYLPCTDTRFRPDQRLLEEGNVQAAQNAKVQVEQAQRERQKKREEAGVENSPYWFRKVTQENGEETWEYMGKYWEARKNPGFMNMNFERLW